MLKGREDVVELVSKDEREVKEVADCSGESNPESVGERKVSGWGDGADCPCALGGVTTGDSDAGSSTCPPGADLLLS